LKRVGPFAFGPTIKNDRHGKAFLTEDSRRKPLMIELRKQSFASGRDALAKGHGLRHEIVANREASGAGVLDLVASGVVETSDPEAHGFLVHERAARNGDLLTVFNGLPAAKFWDFFAKTAKHAAETLVKLHRRHIYHLNISTSSYTQTATGDKFKLRDFGEACIFGVKGMECRHSASVWTPPEWASRGGAPTSEAGFAAADAYMLGRTFVSLIAAKCIPKANPTQKDVGDFQAKLVDPHTDARVLLKLLPPPNAAHIATVNALVVLTFTVPSKRVTLEKIGSATI
jgi:hypothetical protein